MLISAIWQIIFKIENITTFLQSDYLICLLNHAWPNLLSFLKTSSVYFPKAYQFASWKLKYRFQTHHLLRLNLYFSKCIEPIFIPDYNEKLDIKLTLYFIHSILTNRLKIIFAFSFLLNLRSKYCFTFRLTRAK